MKHRAENLKKDKRESRPHLQKAAELLGKHWRETLDRAISEWEIREIAKHRNALRDELEALLELIKTLSRQLEVLGLDPGLLIGPGPEDSFHLKTLSNLSAGHNTFRMMLA